MRDLEVTIERERARARHLGLAHIYPQGVVRIEPPAETLRFRGRPFGRFLVGLFAWIAAAAIGWGLARGLDQELAAAEAGAALGRAGHPALVSPR